jgi:regulator of protease activity HflC (stomatin/prohibitin superfamily)
MRKTLTPSLGDSSESRRWQPHLSPRALLFGAGLSLLPLVFIFIWYFCRIEPGAGEIAVLIHKTGEDLTDGAILALDPQRKGIQLEVLPEGRYFRNPLFWGWEIHSITDIPAGRLAVLTRLFGKEPAPGKIIAGKDSKGIVAEVLTPGKYRLNPYAYGVELFDALSIRPGSVGVVTSLVGQDVLQDDLPPATRNSYLVGEDFKGVVPEVLDPGTYYLNPYIYNVVEVNLQSQRFILGGDDAISFLTLDGFTVNVEGTLEFSIERDKAALLTHQVGDMDDVLKKLILPKARGFSRIEGSKHPAINFIVGETRQQFQNNLETHLREQSKTWGVAIKSVLIRNIVPPDAIASIIREREVSVQNARKFEQQIEQARSMAELTRQEMLAQQNKEKVAAETHRIQAVIRARQEQAVRVTAAQRELDVAQLENEAAVAQAAAIIAKAQAERDVIAFNNQAQAGVIGTQVRAFQGAMNLARYTFYQQLGPRIVSILGSDAPDSLGGLLRPFLERSGVVPGTPLNRPASAVNAARGTPP